MDVETFKRFKNDFKDQIQGYLHLVWKQNQKIVRLMDHWFYRELVMEDKVTNEEKTGLMRLLGEYSALYKTKVPEKKLTDFYMLGILKHVVRGQPNAVGLGVDKPHKLVFETNSRFSLCLNRMVLQLGNLVLRPFNLFFAQKPKLIGRLSTFANEVVDNHLINELTHQIPACLNMFGLLDSLTTMLCTQISINANNFTNAKFANPTPKELFYTLKTFVDQNPLIKTQVSFVSSSAPHPKPPTLFAGSNALYSILNEGTMYGYRFSRKKNVRLPPTFTKSVATFALIGYTKGIGLSIFSNECKSLEEAALEGVPFRLCINIPTLDEMHNKKCWHYEEKFGYYKLKRIVVDENRHRLVLGVLEHDQSVRTVYIPLHKNVEHVCAIRSRRLSPDYPAYATHPCPMNVLELTETAFRANISRSKKCKLPNTYWRWFFYYLHRACRVYLRKQKLMKFLKKNKTTDRPPQKSKGTSNGNMKPLAKQQKENGSTVVKIMLEKFGVLYDGVQPTHLMNLVLLYLPNPMTDSSELCYFHPLSFDDKEAIKRVVRHVLDTRKEIPSTTKAPDYKSRFVPVVAAAFYLGRADVSYSMRLIAYGASLEPTAFFSGNIIAALKRQNNSRSFKTKLQQAILHAQQVLRTTQTT